VAVRKQYRRRYKKAERGRCDNNKTHDTSSDGAHTYANH